MGSVCSKKQPNRPNGISNGNSTNSGKVSVHVIDNTVQTPKPEKAQSSEQQPSNLHYVGESTQKSLPMKNEGPSLSFIKETERNKVSFELYGEELSKVRTTFLNDLKRLSEHTLKISRQELLLVSYENKELVNLLKTKNINPSSINLNVSDKQTPSKMNISIKGDAVNRRGIRNRPVRDYPDHFVGKLIKMKEKQDANQGTTKDKKIFDDSLNLLGCTFIALEAIEEEENDLLIKSSVIDINGFSAEPWNPDIHELQFSLKNNMVDPAELDNALKLLATRSKLLLAPTLTPALKVSKRELVFKDNNISMGNPNFMTQEHPMVISTNEELPPVMTEFRPGVNDLLASKFNDKNLLASLMAIINYDVTFDTFIMRRLIFPQRDSLPSPTRSGIYVVKFFLNGCRRAIIVQALDLRPSLTDKNEQYPHILLEAFKRLYHSQSNVCVTSYVYRLCNWIPERMPVTDTGDVFNSYEKLKDILNSGNLLLFWKERGTDIVRPILAFQNDDRSFKKYIKTLSIEENAPSQITLMDWNDLYSSERIEQLYINWNPTIYTFRRNLHLTTVTNPRFLGQADSESFRFQRTAQLLFMVHPHKDLSETRLVIEKHKLPLNINYKIKYYLFSYAKSRVVIPVSPLREIEVYESQDEVLSDVIIFDENNAHENYVIAIELVPENPADLTTLPENQSEVLTLSMYSFVEFDLIEMPFNAVEEHELITYNMFGHIEKSDSKIALPLQVEALFKLTVPKNGQYEFRLEGERTTSYTISLFKFQNYRYAISQNTTHRETIEANTAKHSLCTFIEEGTYVLRIAGNILEQPRASAIMKSRSGSIRGSFLFGRSDSKGEVTHTIPKHEVRVHFITYSETLTRTFETQTHGKSKTHNTSKLKIEPIVSSSGLNVKKTLTGSWNRQANFGATKAKVTCYQKFMKNPGFVLVVDEDTEVKFKLSPYKNDKIPLPFISMALYEIQDDFSFNPLIEDENYEQTNSLVTETVLLRPNLNGYLVICICMDHNHNGQFELEIRSQVALKSIRDTRGGILQLPFQDKVTGELLPMSGGHITTSSFLLNTGYIIHFNDYKKGRDTLFAELVTSNQTDPVSLYLIATDKVRTHELTDLELANADYNSAFLYEVNSIYRSIDTNTYLILPSTLQTLNKPLNYELKVQCSAKFKLTKMPEINFSESFIFKESETTELSLRFIIAMPTRMLIIIEPEIENLTMQLSVVDQQTQINLLEYFGFVKEGFVFKTLDVNTSCNMHLLSVLSSRPSSFLVRIFTTVPQSFNFVR